MAIKNNRVFGLSVSLSLADIPDRRLALENLGLYEEDLEIIRGTAEAGFDKNDLQTLSNLSLPVWKTFDRYINDVTTYENTLSFSGGSDFQIRGNIDVAGGIGSTSFRYTILDTESNPQDLNAPPVLKWGDISTSRVSSWSTIGNSISYGADVEIGGTLKVGKIKTRTVATTREFDSEVATHKIKLNLNGTTKYIYAMKGIPLRFKGYFRNFLSTVDFQQTQGKKVSWRIVRTDGLTGPEDFADQGTTSRSTLNYRSPFAAERYIEIYYNPDSFRKITLSNTNILQIPKVKLTGLTDFIFSGNGLVDFPDVNFLAPNLKVLNLNNNKFFNASDPNERKLNQTIADKLPASIEDINLRGCFYGGIQQGIFAKFTNLRNLNLQRSGGPYFYPDSTNLNGEIPNISSNDKIVTYNISRNDFRSIAPAESGEITIETATTLVNLQLYDNNNLEKIGFEIGSPVISTVDIGRTKLTYPDFQSRTSLTSFNAYQNSSNDSVYKNWNGSGTLPAGVTDSSYKFSNCSNLTSLNFYQSNIKGYIPKFTGNGSLTTIDLRDCNGLIAGRPGKTDIKCLYEDTFDEAKTVSTFLLSVNNENFAGGIEKNTFVPLNESLVTLYLYANGRFTGDLPTLDGCSALRNIRTNGQGWTGTLPSFSSSTNLYEAYLHDNEFTGSVKYSNKNIFHYLNVSNNNLTSISTTFDVPNLKYFYASNNNFSGTLPNLFSSCPKVEYVYLNDNQFTSYSRNGGLIGLNKLKQIDLSANILSQTAVDNVLYDLVDNYKAANRKGVIVNLLGSNASPSPYPVITGILTAFDPLTQPTILNGQITDLGSVGFVGSPVTTGFAPVTGSYPNINLSYVSESGNGSGAKVTLNVTATYESNRVSTIGTFTAGKNDDTYDQGIVSTIGSFTAPRNTDDPAPYVAGTYVDSSPPSGGTAATVTVSVSNGQVTGVTLTTGGSGYSDTDIITVLDDVTVPVTAVIDDNPGYTSGTYTDSSPPSGGTAATVTVTTDSGYVTGVTLASPGTGYSVGDTITVQSDVSVEVTDIIPRFYTAASYSINSINNGGSNYEVDDELKTSSSVLFENDSGDTLSGHILLTASTLTSKVDTSVFKGIAAAQFLKDVGWTVQVNS